MNIDSVNDESVPFNRAISESIKMIQSYLNDPLKTVSLFLFFFAFRYLFIFLTFNLLNTVEYFENGWEEKDKEINSGAERHGKRKNFRTHQHDRKQRDKFAQWHFDQHSQKLQYDFFECPIIVVFTLLFTFSGQYIRSGDDDRWFCDVFLCRPRDHGQLAWILFFRIGQKRTSLGKVCLIKFS